MNKSKIEWCDRTWNPVTGCSKVGKGCENCYAERHANRFWGDRKFTDVRMHEERLGQPFKVKKPQVVFVNSMSDLFHEDVTGHFIYRVIQEIESACWHTFIVLTKRPERMKNYFSKMKVYGLKLPLNVWLGVSVEDQETADERIPLLLDTPAAHRFVSYEPAIGAVDFQANRYLKKPDILVATGNKAMPIDNIGAEPTLDWVIMGGESGAGARPCHPDWVRSARDQCRDAGVPFLFKQWGEWVPFGQKGKIEGSHEIPRKYIGDTRISMLRVGKKNAGRLIDGEEIMQFPEGLKK